MLYQFRNFISVVIPLFLASTACLGQLADSASASEPSGIIITGLWQGSFIIPHSPAMKHLAQSHPYGAELNVQLQTKGSEDWHFLHRYPKMGINLNYYDYNNDVLGKSAALSFYINKTMWQGRKQQLNLRMGTGIAWFNRKYHLHENHKNTIISQAINAVLQARLEYEWHFSEPLSLSAGLGLNHYSNGATSKPNLGINLPTATVGLSYYTHRVRNFKTPELDYFSKKHYFNISAGIGYKQLNFSDKTKYPSVTLSAYWMKPLNRKSVAVIGLDGFNDWSVTAAQREDSTFTGSYNNKRAAILIGHELLFGKLVFQTHFAVYVYLPYLGGDRHYYERLGIKYHFSNRVFGVVGLKVHRGSADYIEWGLGIRLK